MNLQNLTAPKGARKAATRKGRGVLGIGYHKGHYMSRATQEFIQLAKEQLQEYFTKTSRETEP